MLQDRKFFSVGINCYVPAMAYGASAGHSLGPARHSLGTPAAASAGGVTTLLAAGTNFTGTLGANIFLTAPVRADATYGRNIQVTPSGVPGNANVVEVIGYDYLGQPMFERFTGSAAASTALVGVRAFGWVIGYRIVTAATNSITVSIGFGSVLGLPWKGTIVSAKEGTTNMTYAQINTNITAAVLTDPQTNATGDPRGTYTPTSAPNGTLTYELSMIGDTTVNSAGNGGLLGIRHLAF